MFVVVDRAPQFGANRVWRLTRCVCVRVRARKPGNEATGIPVCIIVFSASFHTQDLLVTQSDYVKAELLSLQSQVQDLDNRAKNVELDIRAVNNKEEEEELMQEWFGLLNRKNELIKRQMELNMM